MSFESYHPSPGHLIRRLHQVAVGIFLEQADGIDITPVQYATLTAASEYPMLDIQNLADVVSIDRSTIGEVIDRLVDAGLLNREINPKDQRARIIQMTAAGAAILKRTRRKMAEAQAQLLAPLGTDEQADFIAFLARLVIGLRQESRTQEQTVATGKAFSLSDQAGHLIRQVRQSCDRIFTEVAGAFEITPAQYASLATLHARPDIDNTRLANLVALDRATMGSIVRRLTNKGLIESHRSETDRRAKSLSLTAAGSTLLISMAPFIGEIEKRITSPLSVRDQKTFMRMMIDILQENNAFSRAPYQAG